MVGFCISKVKGQFHCDIISFFKKHFWLLSYDVIQEGEIVVVFPVTSRVGRGRQPGGGTKSTAQSPDPPGQI